MTTRGFYVGLRDGTIRRAGAGRSAQVFAGAAGSTARARRRRAATAARAARRSSAPRRAWPSAWTDRCTSPTPTLLRVRRIDPSGTITTVAGSGQACASATDTCGDGGAATAAALAGPSGVWASPSGELFIADGERGIRQVAADGTITTVATDKPRDIVSVAGDAAGVLYAAAHDPDYLLRSTSPGEDHIVAGTGTSGYNGNEGTLASRPAPTSSSTRRTACRSRSTATSSSPTPATTSSAPTSPPRLHHRRHRRRGRRRNPQSGFNDDGHFADDTELDAPRRHRHARRPLRDRRYRQRPPAPGRPGPPPPELGGFEPPPISPPARPRPPAAPSPAVGGPSAPALPDNRFIVRRVKVRRNGTITLSVRVRAAGKLDVRATMRRTRRLRPGSGRFVFARAERRARRAVALRVRVRPTARARRFIRRGVRLPTLRLAVTFTPTGGRPRQVERHASAPPQARGLAGGTLPESTPRAEPGRLALG